METRMVATRGGRAPRSILPRATTMTVGTRIAAVFLLSGVAWAGDLRLVDAPREPEAPGLSWLTSLEEASAIPHREKKPLFLFFTAKW